METIKLLMFNYWETILRGLFAGFALSGLISALIDTKKTLKLVAISIFIFFVLLVTYKLIYALPESKNALNEEVNYNKSLEIWRKKKPDEVKLYSQLKNLRSNDKCLICGQHANYGIVYKSKYASSENFTPNKLLVCSEHKELLNIYTEDCKMSDYFKSNYQNGSGFINLAIVQNIDNNSLENILHSSIVGNDIEIKYLIDNIPESKEMILSNVGFYIWMLISVSIIFSIKYYSL